MAMCKYSLHTGQIMIQYVHSFVSVSKNSDCLSASAAPLQRLCIYAHQQQFNLSDPIQVIRLYVFLSKLDKDVQTLALEFEAFRHSPNHMRKRRRTQAGESGNSNEDGRGRGVGPVDADDGDQYMDIMKWRSEVGT